MAKIALMEMALANMIAAGEVVERPASVIKELVENAIDADATKIIIEVNNIGLDSIIVTDNGKGMDKEDLHLAFLRHATSKVFKKDDLNHIGTLGFRGEALPAIASVAKIEIHSRTKDSDGNFVSLEHSKLVNEGSSPMNVGTKVIVKELFYNTPARFKYLRSETAEKNAIVEIFDKLALSNPSIQFKLIMDGKDLKSTLGNESIPALITNIYGKGVNEGLKELHTSIGKIKLDAYFANPKYARSKRSDINIFINKRYVKNYAISQSVIDGYNTLLMTNKYPLSLIYLTIDPTLVDVNVHPQKMEVKLANELMFAYALTPLVKEALEQGNMPIREPIVEVKKEVFKAKDFDLFELAKTDEFKQDQLQEEKKIEILELKLPQLDYIGTFSGTYLIFQNNYGLYLMDQHAAAERIRYEYYETKVGELSSNFYQLLVPKELNLVQADYDLLEQNKSMLEPLGFYFKNNKLTAHPTWLRDKEIDVALHAIIEQLQDEKTISLSNLRNHLAKDIACKGAIKANHQLSLVEINKLVEDLRLCKNPYTCPHGRPVLIKLSEYDIEKMFKRIV